MKNWQEKFGIILELLALGERAFVFKLKKRTPGISDSELEQAIRAWYTDRPGAEIGDGEGIPGDHRRFD